MSGYSYYNIYNYRPTSLNYSILFKANSLVPRNISNRGFGNDGFNDLAKISLPKDHIKDFINTATDNFLKNISLKNIPNTSKDLISNKISSLKMEALKNLDSGNITSFSEKILNIEETIEKTNLVSQLHKNVFSVPLLLNIIENLKSQNLISQNEAEALKQKLSSLLNQNTKAIFDNNYTEFLTSLDEIISLSNTLQELKSEVDILIESEKNSNLLNMEKDFEKKILPRMNSANRINSEFIEKNSLAKEFAGKFIATLRSVQAKLLENISLKLNTLLKNADTSSKQIKCYIDAAGNMICKLCDQIELTNENENSINPEILKEIWAKAPKSAVYENQKAKESINKQLDVITNVYKSLLVQELSKSNQNFASTNFSVLSKSNVDENSERQAKFYTLENNFVDIFLKTNFFRLFLDLLEKEQEMQRKAAEKKAEEERNEKKLEEKKLERKRIEKKLEEKKQLQKILNRALEEKILLIKGLIQVVKIKVLYPENFEEYQINMKKLLYLEQNKNSISKDKK